MRLNRNLLIGLACLILGIVLIVLSEHIMHKQIVVAATKGFFGRVHDFFSHLWKVITLSKDPVPVLPKTHWKIALGLGVVLTLAGSFILLLCGKKRRHSR